VSELTSLTLADARDALRARKISAKELANAHLSEMEKARVLNAYVLETPEHAQKMAAASDAKLAKGEGGPLEGIPLGIKDLFATDGVRTTACSKILENFVPQYESTVTAQLWRDGAVMLGKLNNDEFAMGSSNETSALGNVISPWRRKGDHTPLVPGGSSGGSAAAVAAHLCLGATGTDTGGSIRQPAAFTGIVGIKPTYGRCSRWGIVAFASSLDQAGPFARTVRDTAILLRSMAGHDPKDSTSADKPVPDYEKAIGRSVKGMKIGIPKEYRVEGMPAEIDEPWEKGREWLKAAGAEIVDISLPHTKYALPAYYIVAPAEASSNLARSGQRHRRHVRENARGGVRQGSAPPHHDRYLCALGGLLRRLLSPCAEGPHADQAGFRPGVEPGHRCNPDSGDALGRVRHRRKGYRRSGRDVSQRHLHGDGEHGRASRYFGSRRARPQRAAAWASAHRQAVRRGRPLRLRACHRTGRRSTDGAGTLVALSSTGFALIATQARDKAR
jgi:aspartyl-tRNA(Asn)/glutamyl-tRNA(Gln) amidotransferase subunit A